MTDDENSDGQAEARLYGAARKVVEEGERAFRAEGRGAVCPYPPPATPFGQLPSISDLEAAINRHLWHHGWWIGFRGEFLGCKRKEP